MGAMYWAHSFADCSALSRDAACIAPQRNSIGLEKFVQGQSTGQRTVGRFSLVAVKRALTAPHVDRVREALARENALIDELIDGPANTKALADFLSAKAIRPSNAR